jgi:hypothetical protein
MRDECEHGSLRRSCEICELQAENAALTRRLAPIEAVYERFKHLDKLLYAKELYQAMSPQRKCIYDLWQAIKEAVNEHT